MADEPKTPAGPEPDARQPDNAPIMGELPAWVPDQTLPAQDTELIMATLFADPSNKDLVGNQGGDKPAGGEPPKVGPGVAAPSPAPAAPEPAKTPVGEQAAQPKSGATEPTPPYPGAPGSQPAGGQSPGAQPAPKPAEPVSTPATGMSPEEKLEVQNLRGMVAGLTQQLQQLQKAPPAGPGTQPTPGATPTSAEELQQYQVNLAAPQHIAAALFGDDQAQAAQALNVLLSATATNAVAAAVRHATKLVDDRFTSYSGAQAAENESEQIKREYYGAFPSHNNRLFDTLLESEFQTMFAEMPGLRWGEDARNALGTRVSNKLAALGFSLPLQPAPGQPGGQQQQEQQELPPVTVPGKQPAKPAAMMDTGTRPAADPGPGNFIAKTLS